MPITDRRWRTTAFSSPGAQMLPGTQAGAVTGRCYKNQAYAGMTAVPPKEGSVSIQGF